MKSLTFAEFFAMPPGTIFGQVTGLPHHSGRGLFRIVRSWPGDECSGRSVMIDDLVGGHIRANIKGEVKYGSLTYSISLDDLGPDHRFLIHSPDDLDRLAVLIGRGPGRVAQQEESTDV